MKKGKLNILILVCIELLFTTSFSYAENPIAPREKLLLDFGWNLLMGDINAYTTDFTKGGMVGGKMKDYFNPEFNDSAWRPINLPHDFEVEQQLDKNAQSNSALPDGIAWYRRVFEVSKEEEGKRFILTFDGVCRFSEVFVNGFHVQTHRFGYDVFSVDITEALEYDSENVIMVRVNTLEGAEGWWYEGGGIYRHVWLEKVNAVHIPAYGVAINPELDATMTRANVQVSVEVKNDGFVSSSVEAGICLKDKNGLKIGETTGAKISIEPGQTTTINLNIEVENPELWSPSSPVLYSVETTLKQNGVVIDGLINPIGFRVFKFDTEQGFLVNGKKEILKGVCMHQDHAGVGIAVPDALLRYRLEKLKELGVNAYRSHHPNAPEVAQMCNELGILLLAETRHFSSFSESKEMLESMVRVERNNPCVIAWSLGNEEVILNTQKAVNVVKKMRQTARMLDPQKRPLTLASNRGLDEKAIRELDVIGVNYHTNNLVRKNSYNQPIFSSESGSVVCTRGEYETNEEKRVVSSYDRKGVSWGQSGEELLDFTMNKPEIGGTFYWTGFDS